MGKPKRTQPFTLEEFQVLKKKRYYINHRPELLIDIDKDVIAPYVSSVKTKSSRKSNVSKRTEPLTLQEFHSLRRKGYYVNHRSDLLINIDDEEWIPYSSEWRSYSRIELIKMVIKLQQPAEPIDNINMYNVNKIKSNSNIFQMKAASLTDISEEDPQVNVHRPFGMLGHLLLNSLNIEAPKPQVQQTPIIYEINNPDMVDEDESEPDFDNLSEPKDSESEIDFDALEDPDNSDNDSEGYGDIDDMIRTTLTKVVNDKLKASSKSALPAIVSDDIEAIDDLKVQLNFICDQYDKMKEAYDKLLKAKEVIRGELLGCIDENEQLKTKLNIPIPRHITPTSNDLNELNTEISNLKLEIKKHKDENNVLMSRIEHYYLKEEENDDYSESDTSDDEEDDVISILDNQKQAKRFNSDEDVLTSRSLNSSISKLSERTLFEPILSNPTFNDPELYAMINDFDALFNQPK